MLLLGPPSEIPRREPGSLAERRTVLRVNRLLTLIVLTLVGLLAAASGHAEAPEGCPNEFFLLGTTQGDPADINGNGLVCAHTLSPRQIDDLAPLTETPPPGTPVDANTGPTFPCNSPNGACNANGGEPPTTTPLGPNPGGVSEQLDPPPGDP